MMPYLETSVCHFVGDLRGEAFGKDQRPRRAKEMLGQLSSRERGWVGLGTQGIARGQPADSMGVGWGWEGHREPYLTLMCRIDNCIFAFEM